ncbi:hypothetical protein [Aquamicrobium sp. LC103]|uniref:hypothetical protein n=1 Tax=Aquamicrobium sp. LC103 TaxID=1120658 RepID=UPI00069B646D|nr:hypothetical protein [Aquamicrobium sp. LC103]TKT79154.1 hypothetical protein XW59_009485 [Aquamicrobium sp. LC103]
MQIFIRTTAAAALLAFSGGIGLADDCVDPSSSASIGQEQKTPPVAKDGSKAPLEAQPRDTDKSGQPDQAQKDGSNMPLTEQEGGGDKNLATSQQDTEAQQEGDRTAAAKAEDC